MSPSSSFVQNAEAIELHYWFDDNSHSMDAFVQNKCEFELLGFMRAIAYAFNVEISIETEPLADGGLRRWFKVISKSEKKTAVITTALVISLISSVLVLPISTIIGKVCEKVVEQIFEDEEVKILQKEKLKEEIENIKADTKLKAQQLNTDFTAIKRRSNFYEQLEKYPKITGISTTVHSRKKVPISKEQFVQRSSFKDYILVSDGLEPENVDDAIIEIISPVLKKGDYKWRGIYNGEIESFNMKSNEFKALVQTGKIEFKNGTSIKCQLEIKKKINNNGREEASEYSILRVNEYFDNDKPTETPEGKSHRRKIEEENKQLKIFNDQE